jgi:hypothetical protein
MRALFICLLAVWMASPAQADPLRCAVCNEVIHEKFVWRETHTSLEKKSICVPCSLLETTCFVCGFPVKANYTTLDDGRLICAEDLRLGVVSQSDTEQLFREVKRDVMRVLAGSGVLPDRNIKIALIDRRYMERTYNPTGRGHAKYSNVLGLTSSALARNDDWEHSIFVLDHLPPARFAAVAAHEYGHAWINENVRRGRKLDAESVEGFCEWISYKVMTQRNEAVETKIILENEYTRGQIDAFIKADENYRSYDIIKWIKEGTENQIDPNNPAGVLSLQQEPAGGLLWTASAPSPVPSTLMLRGISGKATRRFALINDRTLGSNESGKVRVGDTNVVVQCLAIDTNSVTIRIQGALTNTQLFLIPSR